MDGEIRAAGRLAGDALAGGVGVVRQVHQAIAARTFRAVGPAAAPVRLVHDAIASAVYAVVGAAHAFVPRVGAAIATQAAPPGAAPLSATRAGGLALAAVNGVFGDRVSRAYPPLGVPMAVRSAGREVPLNEAGLRAAYPDATGRVAVFVHGLCETEAWWRTSQQGGNYGSRLRRDLGYTPVYVRYNTGERVSHSGRRLAELLESLVDGWPVPVDEIALVGHSMGGLVLRSACHYGSGADGRWVAVVRHMCCLGTPHLGAPLEKGANAAAWLLARAPETRPYAGLLNLRSAGIKDLRYGALVDEDWQGWDADELLQDRCTEVPFLPHVAHHFLGATVTGRPGHPVGAALGDLLVRYPSAAGKGRAGRGEAGEHVGDVHHFGLLNHPDVYRQLHAWLA